MFGCYRKAEASDPEIYAAATASVLSEYSQEVIDYITDPRTGLPSRSQWLPSVFEVRQACDVQVAIAANAEKLRALAAEKRNILLRDDTTPAQKSHANEWLERMGNHPYLKSA